MGWAHAKAVLALFLFSLAWASPELASAQPGDVDAGDPKEAQSAEDLRRQAQQIRELIAGQLDVTVDAQELFTVQLDEPEAATELDAVLRRIDEGGRQTAGSKRRRQAVPKNDEPASEEPLGSARDALIQAQVDFLSLPAEKRQRVLAAHEARREATKSEARTVQRQQQTLSELRTQADQLEAFLAGTLDASVDVKPLLRVDLAAPDELALDAARRRAFVADQKPSDSSDSADEEQDLPAKIAAARQRLDSLRRRFVALDEEAKRELLEQHRVGGLAPADVVLQLEEPAEEAIRFASEERQRAIEEAERAETEALRLVADQRAQLLSVKELQARYSAELAERQTQAEAVLDAALAWNRRVRELKQSGLSNRQKAIEANELYPRVVGDLTEARNALREALDTVASGAEAVPTPADADGEPLPIDFDKGSLRALRDELEDEAARLRAAATQLSWDCTAALRDAVVTMNQSRLRLFDQLSRNERHELTGFGPEAVQQVKREIDQIILEARYHFLALPRQLEALNQSVRTSPGPMLVTLFQLVLLIVVFRWWRKRADAFLEPLQRTWLQKRPQTALTRAVAGFIWYLRRIRKPLEWAVFFAILLELIIRRLGFFGELAYLRIIILWAVAAALIVRLVDAVAERRGYSTASSSKLRFRSLRLVGITVVVVGLILSIAEAMVGTGAIYSWVLNTCWLIAIPVFLVLVYWWADTIFERAEQRSSTLLLSWVTEHKDGFLRYPAAAVGGVYLLIEGLYRFLLGLVSEFTLPRRLMAYLSRREIEKQTSGGAADLNAEPIAAEIEDKLGPESSSAGELITSYMLTQVQKTRALVRSADRAAIVAVAGERGEGKTTFLTRVVNDLEEGEHVQVRCEHGGFAPLRAQLGLALGLSENADAQEITERLHERAPKVVCIDDAQRLIKPLIGGLKDIDQLIELMRAGPTATTWLIAISMPAWRYLQRARGRSTPFDEFIELDQWTEEQIASLLEKRTQAADISPSFAGVVVPQQFADSRLSLEDRSRRDFYRILWDYSGGNARVALHFWCRALYTSPPDEQIYVRLPQVPSVGELETQPDSFYFVLRTIVQLEQAGTEDIVRCTDLDPSAVADALRAARVHGYVEHKDELFEISVHWYRAVTSILRRKHLMLL